DLVAQERPEPEIVVAVEVDDRHAGLAQAPQGGERREVTPRDGGSIFEPEVEQVADDVQDGGSSGQGRQKLVKEALAAGLALPGFRSEVEVGEEGRGTGGGHGRHAV